MIRHFKTCALLILFILAELVIYQRTMAQDFPYIAPEAPEFDSRGNPMERTSQKPFSTGRQLERHPTATGNFMRSETLPLQLDRFHEESSTATGSLSSPQAPIYSRAPESPSKPSGPMSFPESPGNNAARVRPPAATSPSPGTSFQPQERSDCSEYPILLAGARSENEMQFNARRYLTCLMQNGWSMDQARQQVINTIESAARVAR